MSLQLRDAANIYAPLCFDQSRLSFGGPCGIACQGRYRIHNRLISLNLRLLPWFSMVAIAM
jgi:hypothetical protein